MKRYIANERLWSQSKEVYTEVGQEVDVSGWTDDDIRLLIELGSIREADSSDASVTES